MSLWRFGDFETEVDLTDADFLDKLDMAKERMEGEIERVPKVGKHSDIIRSQVKCFACFFDTLFGEGTSRKMYGGKNSLELALKSAEEFERYSNVEGERLGGAYEKYAVAKPQNREQRRTYNKQKNSPKNRR